MRKTFCLLLLCLAFVPAHADEEWMGLYLQGNKIGYAFSSLTDTTFNKLPAKKSFSSTVIHTEELGQALSLKIDSTSWLDGHGKPILMNFVISSAGRSEKLLASFKGRRILLDIDSSGAKTKKTLDVPTDANVVDDAVNAVLQNGYKKGKVAYYYVLEPMTASLVKSKVMMEGPATTTINGRPVSGNKIEISDPQTTSYAYFTPKGDLIKVEGPMGIEMLPESKAEALSDKPSSSAAGADIAFDTCITPNKPITNIGGVKELKLSIHGHDLSALPTDAHQTVSKQGSSWIVDIHPIGYSANPASVSQAASEMPDWIKPSQDLPSDSPTFQSLAEKLTAGCTAVPEAAKKIHDYVYSIMKPNAGIGVLRDASEILKTKEGVCRDYAVLTATLLRAAKVPSKLVSGLEYADGSFYYHAWAEVWDGTNWVGVDSTLANGDLTAGHIQLAQGNIDEAFKFTFLDKVKIEVLDARRI